MRVPCKLACVTGCYHVAAMGTGSRFGMGRHVLEIPMADDPSRSGAHYRIRMRVNVSHPYEVGHWTRQFGVTEPQLMEAVWAVGVFVEDVCRYLAQKVR